jgi:hypothetical protein
LIHDRHFTVDEANALLERLEAVLGELRDARDRLTDAELHEALAGAAPQNGGGEPGREVGEAFLDVRRMLMGLEEAGIVIRDIDRGLVDFPAMRDGREVYLCWRRGEESVGYWHELESGFRGREPID